MPFNIISSYPSIAESTSHFMRFGYGKRTMEFRSFILLIGFCFPHSTTAAPRKCGEELSFISMDTLMKVSAPDYCTHIDLSHRALQWIAEFAFDGLKTIKSLDLSCNRLKILPPSIFSKLNNLEELSLRLNGLYLISGAFIGLRNLKYLDISYNPITDLKREYLRGLPKSTNIRIKANEVEFLTQTIDPFEYGKTPSNYPISPARDFFAGEPLSSNLEVKICKTDDGLVKSVEELKENDLLNDCVKANIIRESSGLDLSNLGLRKFQRHWYKLPSDSVKKIKLYNNEITEITPELLNDLPSGVSFVDLSYNNIRSIKANIIKNSYIKAIYFDSNLLSRIEDGAFENTNLSLLSVRRNRLDDLAFVKTLPGTIEKLELPENSFPQVSANTFRSLKELKGINLSECRIERIESGAFEDQKKLVELFVNYNRISELKPGLFKRLKNLKIVELSNNRIKKISRNTFPEMEAFNNSRIYLGGNLIDNIEEGSFSNLKINMLDLARNRITEKSIAKGVFNTTAVKKLHLDENSITKIDGLFSGISGVTHLGLAGNQITNIEKGDIEDLPNVLYVSLGQNPFHRLDNGAFHGFSNENVVIDFQESSIEYIQAGVFDDV